MTDTKKPTAELIVSLREYAAEHEIDANAAKTEASYHNHPDICMLEHDCSRSRQVNLEQAADRLAELEAVLQEAYDSLYYCGEHLTEKGIMFHVTPVRERLKKALQPKENG